MSTPVEFKYRAFLSYAHADKAWAAWLHRQLESFRIDGEMVGRETPVGPVPKTLRPIFRDRDDFTGGNTLKEATIAALDASAVLIVLCSTVSATRPAVNEEVRLFRSRHPDRPVIPVIVDGRFPDNFPPAARFEVDADGNVTDRPVVILGPNLMPDKDGRSIGLAKIVAGVLGVGTDEIVQRAARDQRRRLRNWIVGLSFVVVSLAGLAVLAEINRREAVQQRGVAEARRREAVQNFELATRRYDAAKRAADGITLDLARNLRTKETIPQETVEVILNAANGVMNRLLADSDNDPELRLSHAKMLYEYGLVFWLRGITQTAKSYGETCLATLDLVAKSELAPALRSDAVVARHKCLYLLADAYRNLGQLDRSEAVYRDASSLLQALIGEGNSAGTELLLLMARVRARTGDLFRTQGRFREASAEYQASLDANLAIAEREPLDDAVAQEISWRHNQIGDNLLEITDHESLVTVATDRGPRFRGEQLQAALPHYMSSLRIRRRLSGEQPRNPDRRRDMVWSLALAGMAQASADLEAGVQLLGEGLSEAQRLLDEDPENTEPMRYKALLHNFIGDTHLRRGHDDDAFAEYAKGMAIRRTLAQRNNAAARWQRDLFYTDKRTVEVCRGFGSHAICAGALDEALILGPALVRSYPSDEVLAKAVGVVSGLRRD